MATRGRGGRVNPIRPSRLIIKRVYEQFRPRSEWRQEDDHDTLLVYLPGFQKEYIKVTTEDLNVVRVRGERLVSENKWSRFQEDYRVPETCEMSNIRARFNGGILTITMPRKIANASPRPPPTTTTTAPPKTKEQVWKPKDEPKEEKPDRPQTTHLENNTLPAQPKPPSSPTPTEQQPSKPAPPAEEAVKLEHDAVEQLNASEKPGLDKGKGKEAILLAEMKRDLNGSKGKSNYSRAISGGLQGLVARRGMVNDDRKLLVNVGVGVLMIAALGVHVSYTIGLIGKG